MRRVVFAISIIAIGLLLALPLASRVEALGGGGSHNPLTVFKNDDKEKDKDQGNGNGNGQSDDDHGNGQSDDNHGNGNGNGGGNGDNSDDQGDQSHGNAGGNGNGNGGGDGNASDDQGDGNANGDNSDDSADSGSGNSHGTDDHGNSAEDEGNNDSQSASDHHHGASSGHAEDVNDSGTPVADDEDVDESGTPVADNQGKVRICHLTGRDDFPYNLIEVSEHALKAHEGHGDFVASEDAISSNDCEAEAEGSGTPVAATEVPSVESGTPAASPESEAKVLVCHVTGSSKNPVILIEVSANALPAHLRHGDIEAPVETRSSNDCESALQGTPVASPVVSS